MKRPTWATVVGILSIIFGLFGLLASVQLMGMRKMMDVQQDMMANMQKTFPQGQKNAPDPKVLKQTFDKLIGQRPEWFNTVSIALGLAGIAVYGLYLFGGISLLNMKKNAVGLLYTALVLAIVYAITRTVVLALAYSGSMMGIAMIIPGILGVVINVVMLLVILSSDKVAFRGAAPPPPLPTARA